jgi:predicted alpha/beta hydrolase family esterase
MQKQKRAIIVHGWDGTPEDGWFPWLRTELAKQGFEVVVPQLPDPLIPRIAKWVPTLAAAVVTRPVDEQTYFVGHSMGCQTIARYLETLPEGQRAGGAVFVAGFFKRLTGIEDTPDEQLVKNEWLGTPIDLAKVKPRLPKSVAIFSDDDPFVPLDDQDDFRDKLGSEIIVQHHMGHFSGGRDKAFELPIVLEKILAF